MKSILEKVLYRVLRPICAILLYVLYRPQILNKEKIPKNEAVIIAGNHIHAADPVNVIVSTRRIVYYMAKEELFKGFHGIIFKAIGLIPVYKRRGNAAAVMEAEKILNNGGMIGIFPEGTRNRSNELLLPFRHGAVSIAQKTNTRIVPFAICGKYKLFRKGPLVEFGDPIDVSNITNEEANTLLKNSVLEILKRRNCS